MSKSNPGRRWDPEQRKYLVENAVNQMKFVQDAKSAMSDPVAQMMDRLSHLLVDARVHIKPVLQAGGGFDEPALKELIGKFVFEELHRVFSKEEQHAILTILLSDDILADVRNNPHGGDKPDLLSGN